MSQMVVISTLPKRIYNNLNTELHMEIWLLGFWLVLFKHLSFFPLNCQHKNDDFEMQMS